MSWKEDFNQALLRFVREDLSHPDAVKVTGFEQIYRPGFRWSEYTADSDETVIEIYFANEGGPAVTEWRGDFGELISRLSDA